MNKLDSWLIVRYSGMFSWHFNWSPLIIIIIIISGKLLTLRVTVPDSQDIQHPSYETTSALIELFVSFLEFLIDHETCIRGNGLGSRGMQLLLVHDDS